MEQGNPQQFTKLLERYQGGEKELRVQLLAATYAELRRLAAHYMSGERHNHTLQPTALVHEAWMRFGSSESQAKNKAHFMALAAGVMKEILIDHARKHLAAKRGGKKELMTYEDSLGFASGGPDEIIELCDTLGRLRELDERQAKLVELRIFGGMSFEEVAEVLEISLATAKRDWLAARAWLCRELT